MRTERHDESIIVAPQNVARGPKHLKREQQQNIIHLLLVSNFPWEKSRFFFALSAPGLKFRIQLMQLTFVKLCNPSAGSYNLYLSFTNFVLNNAAPRAYAYLNTLYLWSLTSFSGPVNNEFRKALVHTLLLFSFSSVNEWGLDVSVSIHNKDKKFSSSASGMTSSLSKFLYWM